jgi:hypothetical protein
METLNLLAAISSIASFLVSVFGVWKIWPLYKDWKLRREAWDLYVYLRTDAGSDIYTRAWDFKPGTRGFQLAEHLVDEGKLFRRAMGSYGLWVSELERGGNP